MFYFSLFQPSVELLLPVVKPETTRATVQSCTCHGTWPLLSYGVQWSSHLYEWWEVAFGWGHRPMGSWFPDWDWMAYIIVPRERGRVLCCSMFGSMRCFPLPAGSTGEGVHFTKLALVSVFMEGSGCRGLPVAISALGGTWEGLCNDFGASQAGSVEGMESSSWWTSCLVCGWLQFILSSTNRESSSFKIIIFKKIILEIIAIQLAARSWQH